MRFITLVKCGERTDPPPQALMDAIDKIGIPAAESGFMVETGGLAPTATSARVTLRDGRTRVLDGPFPESKEVIGGYAIFEAASQKEVVDMTVKFVELHRQHWPGWEGEVEVRQMFVAPEYSRKG